MTGAGVDSQAPTTDSSNKTLLLVAGAVFLLVAAAGGVAAYLMTDPGAGSNDSADESVEVRSEEPETSETLEEEAEISLSPAVREASATLVDARRVALEAVSTEVDRKQVDTAGSHADRVEKQPAKPPASADQHQPREAREPDKERAAPAVAEPEPPREPATKTDSAKEETESQESDSLNLFPVE